jgi:hypothetical protein
MSHMLKIVCCVAGAVIPVLGVAGAEGVREATQVPHRAIGPEPSSEAGKPKAGLRSVEGIPVPPFGYTLKPVDGAGFTWSEGFFLSHLMAWPDQAEVAAAETPLAHGKWTGGPYKNASGQRWVEQVNVWYQDGSAAGLSQDTFRSFDDGHSSIRKSAYPQMTFESPVASLGAPGENIFRPRATMGVQSYGSKGQSVIEARSRAVLRAFCAAQGEVPPFQRSYRLFYENNFVFAAPAVGSYKPDKDTFAFLSPFYLHSIGASGTDSKLLKPLVYASAALPPALKTRMLRQGLFVPTMHYLFKSHIAGDIKLPKAHVPAYALPDEAADDFEGSTPFLDGLLNSAHSLTHIPPVCRMRVVSFAIEAEEGHDYGRKAYYEDNIYALSGALRHGQAFVLTVDLRFSWTDRDLPPTEYFAAVLRGEATIESLNKEDSMLRIRIPWLPTNNRTDLRTDLLLLVHDGTYYSAPAYISVRHIHRHDPITLGIKAQ